MKTLFQILIWGLIGTVVFIGISLKLGIMLIFIALFLALSVIGLITLRVLSPHSRQMAREEEHARKKEGGSVSQSETSSREVRRVTFSKSTVGWIVVAVIAIGLLIWGFERIPMPTASSSSTVASTINSVGTYVSHHSLATLLVAILLIGVVFFFITLIKNAKRQKIANWTVLALVAVAAIALTLNWWQESSSVRPVRTARTLQTPPTLYPQTHVPNALNGEWVNILIQPGSRSAMIPVPVGKYLKMKSSGTHLGLLTIYADGHECAWHGSPCPPGNYVGSYITNEGKQAAWAAYSFIPIS